MNLVEQHIINKSHRLFLEIDDLSFKSKNLYKVKYEDLKQVRIIPKYDHYVIEVVYQKEEIDNGLNEKNVMGIVI